MKSYSLPIDFNELKSIDTASSEINMHELNFPCDKSKQIRSAFIFLRNTDLSIKLNFDECSYEEKEEFLLFYLKGNIILKAPIFDTTWLEILLSEYSDEVSDNSILTRDEIKLFIKNNSDFIKEVRRLAISLPLCSIYLYLTYDQVKTDISVDEFDISDYNEINMGNFINLLDYDTFIILIQPVEGISPVYYRDYFDGEHAFYKKKIISKLPFLNMLNIMMNPNSIVEQQFIDGINGLLNVKEENND